MDDGHVMAEALNCISLKQPFGRCQYSYKHIEVHSVV